MAPTKAVDRASLEALKIVAKNKGCSANFVRQTLKGPPRHIGERSTLAGLEHAVRIGWIRNTGHSRKAKYEITEKGEAAAATPSEDE